MLFGMRPLLCLLALAACADPPPPAAPTGGIGPLGRVRSSRPLVDAGPDAMFDGGPVDPGACMDIRGGDPLNQAAVSSADATRSFEPLSAVAYFEPTACADGAQRMVLLLSEDATCDLRGKYFAVVVDAAEVGRLITVGAPIAISAAAGLDIFYVEGATTSDRFLWRNCVGSDGDITFSFLDPSAADNRQAATFDLLLLGCDSDLPPIFVTGSVDLPLEATFTEICRP